METIKMAQAGSLESGDVFVTIEPMETDEPEIELESLVMEQYGRQILETIRRILTEHHVKKVKLTVRDRGALDYAIRSRVETVLIRAGWEGLK